MKRLVRGMLVMATAGLVVVGFGAPAHASSTLPLVCLANGSAQAQPHPDGTAEWLIDGSGTCQGDFTGTYTMTLHGRGSSVGLSQCSGGVITQNLALAVQVEITNLSGSKLFEQSWSLPIDNYSVRTPFLIGGAATGVGYIGHNIFLACPGNGTPAASFLFSFLG